MPECPSCSYKSNTKSALIAHYESKHEQLAKEIVKCSTDGCSNIFSYYPSSKEGNFCKKCVKSKNYHLTENKVDYFEVICENCRESFEVTESRYNSSDMYFCEKSCRDKYYKSRKGMECQNCGTKKMVESWEIEQGRKYCDRNCYIEDIQPADDNFNHEYYGPSFEKVREKVRIRDNSKCQICGKAKNVIGRYPSAHHITPVACFINNDNFVKDDANYVENLILLCEHHHTKVEKGVTSLNKQLDDKLLEKLELEPPIDSQ